MIDTEKPVRQFPAKVLFARRLALWQDENIP
jgi:hypothetical protein